MRRPHLAGIAMIWLAGLPGSLRAEAVLQAPVVSAVEAAPRELVERAIVSGTLVPRDEILVTPELDGVRVTEVLVEEGDRVAKDQVLARLSGDMLGTELAQNAAVIARARAAIAQGASQVDQADAAAVEARLAMNRADELSRSGNATQATVETRVSASKSADGRLAAARSGSLIAAADLAQAEAQRTELNLRLARTEIRAPVEGIVSRRTVRVGAAASANGEAMFRIIAHGTVELEGEVTEAALRKMTVGAPAVLDGGVTAPVHGRVRAVYPEIDRTTRLGKVRIALDPDPSLHIGGFARGTVELSRRTAVAVPLASLLFSGDSGAKLLVIADGRVSERVVDTGLSAGGYVEIRQGVKAGEVVVARAGSFLRDGDAVRIAPPKGQDGQAAL